MVSEEGWVRLQAPLHLRQKCTAGAFKSFDDLVLTKDACCFCKRCG
jgi:hypothetical protein